MASIFNFKTHKAIFRAKDHQNPGQLFPPNPHPRADYSVTASRCAAEKDFRGSVFRPKRLQPRITGKFWMFIPSPSHLGFQWLSWVSLKVAVFDQLITLASPNFKPFMPWYHRASYLSRQVVQVDIFALYPTIDSVRRFNMTLSEILRYTLRINGSVRNLFMSESKMHLLILFLIQPI